MLGWFLRLIESFQSAKKRKTERKVRQIKRKEKLKIFENKETSNTDIETNKLDKDKNGSKKERAKLWLIRIIRAIVQFIESVIMWIIGLLGVHITLVLFAGVILLIIIMSVLSISDSDILDQDITSPPSIDGGSSVMGTLNWTIDELNSYKDYLTIFEQNLFKIGILTKDSINGYGVTDEYKTVLGRDVEDILFKMSLGVQTTETSWRMYDKPSDTNKLDVFINPSDLYKNPGGIEGPYQMGSGWTLSNLKPEIQSKIKAQYTNPHNGGDRHYYPYATAISVFGTYNKMNEQGLNKPKYTDIFKRIAPSFGITTDYDRFEVEAIVMLMQTAYLSAPKEPQRDGICAFLAGVWAMSSDDPNQRTFQNYSLDFSNGLDISTANHQQFFGVGSGGGFVLEVPDEKGDLRNLTFGLKKTIKLNGEYLDKPLVAEVVTKYWDIPEIQKYNSDVLAFSRNSSSTQRQFVLSGIYGVESYLSGRQITEYIASKLPIRVVNIKKGNFQETPGLGQGNWGGKTIEELSAGNSGAMKFKQYWGTSDDLKNGLMTKWRENDRWGVPFYYQSSKYDTYPISYGLINWFKGGGKDLNACAYYMSAYIASGLTGKMINSAEMASALIATNSVDTQGLYKNDGAKVTFDLLGINFRQFVSGTKADVLKSFGLKIKNENTLWADRWYYIDEILADGGLVGVSVNGNSVFTNYGHYMVITGKDEASGKYHVYTSSSTKQTQTLYDRSAFDGKLRKHGYFFAKLK